MKGDVDSSNKDIPGNIIDVEDELIEIDRFEYNPHKMILSEANRRDIQAGKGNLTENERMRRLFSYIHEENSYEFRRTLTDDNSVINTRHDGTFLLHRACAKGSVDIVTFLLFSNADCNISDDDGLYPQHHAALSGCPILIDILSVFGHDLNILDGDGNTPLHLAVELEDKVMIHMLINYKVRLLKNNENNTPIDICEDRDTLNALKKHYISK